MRRIIILFAIFGMIFCSCVKEEQNENVSDVYDRELQAWLRVHGYSDYDVTESGVIILDEKPGSGAVIRDSSFVFLKYYCTDLDGNIQSSNIEEIDRQLGTYSPSTYYGPDIYRMNAGVLSEYIQEPIIGMREGTECTIIIPSKLSSDSSSEMVNMGVVFTTNNTKINMIYHLELTKVTESITEYEENALAEYRDKYFPGLDTLSVGYYFIKTKTLPEQDSLENEASINVRYIGRMLDGTVFDTNIADSAKFYRIYSASSDYKALSMKYYVNLSDMITNNNTVSGFSRAVYELKEGESATTFFWSVVGYQDEGNDAIPGYTPLRFDIWIEE